MTELNLDSINLSTWFSERELTFVPVHFVAANSRLTTESIAWTLENLQGRYAIRPADPYLYYVNTRSVHDVYESKIIFFEDPTEALFYDLRWS